MAAADIPAVGLPSTDAIQARNSTKVNLAFQIPGGNWARVGRVQSMSEDISNNVQVLMELGSQFAVELKKGITTFSFSIARFYVHTDVFDGLSNGATFAMQITDDSGNGSVVLEQFQSCAINTISRSFQQGQATVGQNASVVVIGQSYGQAD